MACPSTASISACQASIGTLLPFQDPVYYPADGTSDFTLALTYDDGACCTTVFDDSNGNTYLTDANGVQYDCSISYPADAQITLDCTDPNTGLPTTGSIAAGSTSFTLSFTDGIDEISGANSFTITHDAGAGLPTASQGQFKRRKQESLGYFIPEADMVCSFGESICPVPGVKQLRMDAFECVDVVSGLETCGGCFGTEGSQDCSALDGVADVACVAGLCIVRECEDGFRIAADERTCVVDLE